MNCDWRLAVLSKGGLTGCVALCCVRLLFFSRATCLQVRVQKPDRAFGEPERQPALQFTSLDTPLPASLVLLQLFCRCRRLCRYYYRYIAACALPCVVVSFLLLCVCACVCVCPGGLEAPHHTVLFFTPVAAGLSVASPYCGENERERESKKRLSSTKG